MPRVNTARAAKDYPDHGIKKGDTYYYWTFYRGAKHMSKDRPRQSQLTQRADYGALYVAQELAEDLDWGADKRESLVDGIADVISSLEGARDAAQEKYDNLPENFQNSDQGQNIEGFVADCESAITELEGIKDELEDEGTKFEDIGTPEDITWPGEYD